MIRTSPHISSMITGDKTWIYYHNIPTKAQKNKIWIFVDEDAPVSVRKSKSVKKQMLAVFFLPEAVIGLMSFCKQRRQSQRSGTHKNVFSKTEFICF